MELVDNSYRQLLQEILDKFETTEQEEALSLNHTELERLYGAGVLYCSDGYTRRNLVSEEEMAEFFAHYYEPIRNGDRILITNGSTYFYTVEIPALKKYINQLDGKQTVSEREKKHTDTPKPHANDTQWREKVKGSLASISDDTVGLIVRVEPETRDKFHAIMRAKGSNAQEFLANIVEKEVKENPELIVKGEQMEAKGYKRAYRSKLQMLKEENARLRAASHNR